MSALDASLAGSREAAAACRVCRLSHADCGAALAAGRAVLALQAGRRNAGLPVLFADPAWDMLLDLFVARGERRSISVSSLCIAAGVPASTAHRWIQVLARAGAVRRRADPLDRRRVYIEIAEQAFAAMAAELLRHRDRMVRSCS